MDKFISEMHDFNIQYYHKPRRISYSLLMEDGEKLVLYKSPGQPCYGDLRTYQAGEYKPGDLQNPFPAGTPVAIGIPFTSRTNKDGYRDFVINDPRSPWHEVLHEVQPTYDSEKNFTGFVITDTNVDPTALINLFMFCRCTDERIPSFKTLVDNGIDPRIALMVLYVYSFYAYGTHLQPYCLNNVNPKMFFNGIFRKEPDTFRNRYPYRRQGLEYLFSHSKKKFSHSFEISKLTLNAIKEKIVPFLEAQINKDE